MKLKPLCGIFIINAAAIFSGGPFQSELELSPERFYAIKAEIKQTPDPVIVFGDSIVEGAPLPKTFCGHAVVNAGVTGAGIQYFERHAAELLGSSRPSLIVLAVGINNSSPTAAKQFQSHYRETVALLARAAAVVVATITPVKIGPGSVGYDPKLVRSLNTVIKATPIAVGVIDLNQPLSGPQLTSDGIHLNKKGYAMWISAMVAGIRDALDCTGGR
jgi:lysophospholipase L1-like esterase